MEAYKSFTVYAKTNLSMTEAGVKMIELLGKKGFRIFSDMDIKTVFEKNLNKDFLPYRLLGVCNPGYCYRIFTSDKHFGVLVPSKVAIWDNGDTRTVAILDPRTIAGIPNPNDDEMTDVAIDAFNDLKVVLEEFESLN